jgi:predicted MFS family arabinose efflux permease
MRQRGAYADRRVFGRRRTLLITARAKPCSLPRHAGSCDPVSENHREAVCRATLGSACRTSVPANPALLVAIQGLRFVLFPIPIITLFFKDQLGLSIGDVLLLQAAFGLVAVVLEFPSGYVADRLGHRLALIVAGLLWLVGWVLYARASDFASALVAESTLAAGLAFLSGADAALLYESLKGEERAADYTRWEGRGRAAGQICEATSSAVGGWLYSLTPRLPFYLQIPIAAAALGLAVATREVREPARDPSPHRSHLDRVRAILRFAATHRELRAAFALSVSLGLSSFVMVWLIQPYVQARGVPTAWLGPLWAAANLWLAAASLASARVADAIGLAATLLLCVLLAPTGYVVLASVGSAWGAVGYLLLMTVRGLQGPLLAAAIQRAAPSEDRASVISLNSLLFRLGFVVVGPAIGALVDLAGMERTLGVLAVVFGGAGLASFAAFRRAC